MGKRSVDVIGSLVLLVVAAPVIALAAVVSTVTFRSSPFFVQERIGRAGRPFRLVKVRTLAPSTPTQLEKAFLEDHEPPWACRFLRAHHLDELPQLVQVLVGTMSLVGPRPEMPDLAVRLGPDVTAAREQVRPGITGLWQVSLAVRGLICDDPSFDLLYVQQRTGRMDLWIIWRTVAALVGVEPIATVHDVPAWTRRRSAAPAPTGSVASTEEHEGRRAVPVGAIASSGAEPEAVEAASSPAT